MPDPKIDQNMSGLVTSYSSEDECDEYGREKKPSAATAGLPTTSFYSVCFFVNKKIISLSIGQINDSSSERVIVFSFVPSSNSLASVSDP